MGYNADMNYTPLETIPDVSFYQDDNLTPQQIDFVKMRTLSEGVIIRAGQNTWVDPDFVHNWQAAKAAGLKRGVYWFYDSRSDPIAQAQRFFDLVKNDPPEWGMWCDLEESYGGTWKGEANYKKFTAEVDRLYNGVVGIYTANWWWSVQGMVDNSFWAKYPLWVAQYVSSPQYVTLPKPWTSAVLWQYTSKGDGLAYGAESLNIDLNYTSQAFYNFFGGTVPPTNGGTMKEGVLTPTTASLRVRSGPAITYPQIGGILQGDKVYGTVDSVSGWLHIEWIIRAGGLREDLDGWCSASSTYITLTDYVPPEPVVPVSMEVDLPKGATLTLTFSDGTKESWTA